MCLAGELYHGCIGRRKGMMWREKESRMLFRGRGKSEEGVEGVEAGRL